GAANVEPAPETVADVELAPPDVVELDLPHAPTLSASSAQLASAPILFLFTTSPLTGFLATGRAMGPCAGSVPASLINRRGARCEHLVKVRLTYPTAVVGSGSRSPGGCG